jgi:hypothetical protein
LEKNADDEVDDGIQEIDAGIDDFCIAVADILQLVFDAFIVGFGYKVR